MRFIIKRLIITVITLFLVSVLTFSAFRIIPGDAALLSLGMEADEMQIEALREEMGLNKSFPMQYISWLGKFLKGDLGNSSRWRGASINELILGRLPLSLCLSGFSFLLLILISVPVAFLSARKKNSILDRLVTFLTALNISMPGFFLGVLFIWIFGITLKFFVPGAYNSFNENPFAFLKFLFFPALAIALPNSALLVKFLKTSIYRESQNDYVRTARSKGGNRSYILRRHIFKNASLPAITLLGMIAGEVFSGSIVIEQVFGIPGIGRLLVASIMARDYHLVETLVIVIAFMVIMANTIADIALEIVDPRIRISEKI